MSLGLRPISLLKLERVREVKRVVCPPFSSTNAKQKKRSHDYADQATGRFPVSRDYAALLVATPTAVSRENWVTGQTAIVARRRHGDRGQGWEERQRLGPGAFINTH